jgi:NAD(P)-dependent dehydrogenase (short-subunit alcohol dehydrogenase family)
LTRRIVSLLFETIRLEIGYAMDKQTAVVFGGSSGIGEAVARRFASEGVDVVAVGRDPRKLDALRASAGPALRTAQVDAIDGAAVAAFFAEAGPLDHLVLALSGGRGAGPFKTLPLDDIRSGLEAKLFPQLVVAQAALPRLRPGGSITFITAASARVAFAGASGLGAINGALESMVPALARELAPIRVNAVSPGVIDTPWWDAMPADAKAAFFDQARATLPVRRVGAPDDVAAAITMLAHNAFVTGVVLPVDGGAALAG